ncbi:MAG: nucleosome assembly protein [Amphiamblys sp. WSBS2006]|nr:MAG: nucleosome assembly protein [Amphiamblys sp. WSBS2006]
MDFLTQKLNKLTNTFSGYVETLPQEVQERVQMLEELDAKHASVDAKIRDEIQEIHRRHQKEMDGLYHERECIVAPREGEGIPEFWLTVLKNTPEIACMLNERDEEALRYLRNIRYVCDAGHGYTLVFEFDENPFFANGELTKEYKIRNVDDPETNDLCLENAVGCSVAWKPGMDLRKKKVEKKRKHKMTGEVKLFEEMTEEDSFFCFFYPKDYSSLEQPAESALDEEESYHVQRDFEVGDILRNEVIPHAVKYFTGDAVAEEYVSDDEDDEDESDKEK